MYPQSIPPAHLNYVSARSMAILSWKMSVYNAQYTSKLKWSETNIRSTISANS